MGASAGEPEFLTGGRKIPDEPTKVIATRAALAVEFEIEVSSNDGVHQLYGVFSWTAMGLDGERSDRTYFDLDVEMEWAAEMLKARIYDWDVFGKPSVAEEARAEESSNKDISVDGPSAQARRSWQFWRKKR